MGVWRFFLFLFSSFFNKTKTEKKKEILQSYSPRLVGALSVGPSVEVGPRGASTYFEAHLALSSPQYSTTPLTPPDVLHASSITSAPLPLTYPPETFFPTLIDLR